VSQRTWLLCTAVLLLFAESSTAQINTDPRLRLRSLTTGGRSGAPISVEVKLEYNRPQVLEGDLILEIYDSEVVDEQLLGTVTWEAIVLYNQDYIFRTSLPPLRHSFRGQYQIVAWFQTADRRISLSPDEKDVRGPHEILTSSMVRSFAVANITAHPRVSRKLPPVDALNRSLEFEKEGIPIYHSRWEPDSWPENPLRHCSYDIVTTTGASLSRLNEKQLTGISDWIAAGGTFILTPDATELNEIHRRFLMRIFRDSTPPLLIPFSGDISDALVAEAEQQPVLGRYELGRTALVQQGDLKQTLTGAELARFRNHVWKLRENWGQRGTDNGTSLFDDYGRRGPAIYSKYRNLWWNNLYPGDISTQPRRSGFSRVCSDVLMPTDVQTVPGSVVALLLASYVLLVGPVDYFVLGLIGRRKWTWFLFPAFTAIYTYAAIEISHDYLASESNGKTLTVVDIGAEGQELRQSRLKLFFMGADVPVEQEEIKCLTVPVHDADTEPVIHLSGRFPQSYQSRQNARQWQPLLRRMMSIGPSGTDLPALPWKQLTDGTARQADFVEALKEIHTDRNNVSMFVVGIDEMHSIWDSQLSTEFEPDYEQQITDPASLAAAAETDWQTVAAMSVHNWGQGFMAVAEQVAPQGSASCEDLFLLGPDDESKNFVLMVIVEEKDTVSVYRRKIDAKGLAVFSGGVIP